MHTVSITGYAGSAGRRRTRSLAGVQSKLLLPRVEEAACETMGRSDEVGRVARVSLSGGARPWVWSWRQAREGGRAGACEGRERESVPAARDQFGVDSPSPRSIRLDQQETCERIQTAISELSTRYNQVLTAAPPSPAPPN